MQQRFRTLRRSFEALPEPIRGLFLDPEGPDDPARHWPIWSPGPLAHGTAGLRILPGRPVSDWPLVRGDRGCGTTWGSTGAVSVPVALYWGWLRVRPKPRSLARRRKRWPALRDAVRAFHAARGGTPDLLEAFEHALHDDVLDGWGSLSDEERASFDAQTLRRLDPTPVHQRARDAIVHQLTHDTPLVPPDDLGVFEGLALAFAFTRAHDLAGLTDGGPPVASIAWRMLHVAPQFDLALGWNHRSGHRVVSTGVTNDQLLQLAMVALTTHGSAAQREAWADDPWMQTVGRAVAADRKGPWHLAYLEAAAVYDAADAPELAWNMLCAGHLWATRRGGPWRPFADAARALAERRGWDDCVGASAPG